MRTKYLIADQLQMRHRAGMPVERCVRSTQLRTHTQTVRDLERRRVDNHDQLKTLVAELVIVWPHPGHFTGRAAFAIAAGSAPVQACSGRHQRHRRRVQLSSRDLSDGLRLLDMACCGHGFHSAVWGFGAEGGDAAVAAT